MSVLLLRLAGPMQSWGVQSRFSVRDTGREPSKSGVIGLLCAALGWQRQQESYTFGEREMSLAEFARSLTMGVRVEREGRLAKDYHTSLNVAKAGGGIKDCEPSTRYFLADYQFLVGFESADAELLKRLDAKLRTPHWPLYLGRKAFLPCPPVPLGADDPPPIQEGDLLTVLKQFPRKNNRESVRFVIEVDYGIGEPRPDQPVSFARREFHVRHVQITFDPQPTSE
jgi:CRISPR system Cascade subunit CasD